MVKIDEFILKDGRKVDIVLPEMDGLQAINYFVNRLTDEDTFLTFTGEHISLEMEKNWLENTLTEMKFKKNYILWAKDGDHIIGSANITKGKTARDAHVGLIGIMVDKDYRRGGLGRFLLESILTQAEQMEFKIAKLDVFSDNEKAIRLYKSLGFIEYGCLPNGLFRQEKYSDDLSLYKKI